jgi:hypothetical protein
MAKNVAAYEEGACGVPKKDKNPRTGGDAYQTPTRANCDISGSDDLNECAGR